MPKHSCPIVYCHYRFWL